MTHTPDSVERARQRVANGTASPREIERLRRWDDRAAPSYRRIVEAPTAKRSDVKASSVEMDLALAIADIEAVLETVDDGHASRPAVEVAQARMRDDRPGQPGAQALDGAGGRPAPGSRPPAGWGQPDDGGAALTRTRDRVRRLVAEARDLRRDVEGWLPREPSESARREVEREGEQGCDHCRAVLRTWSPVYRRGNVGGSLKAPMALCRWDYDLTLATGALPRKADMQAHAAGRKVYRKVAP